MSSKDAANWAASELLGLKPTAISSKVTLYQPVTARAAQHWVGLFGGQSFLYALAQALMRWDSLPWY